MTPDDARRAGVATIYQELLLFPELSVAENIFLGHAPLAGPGRIDWRAMRTKAEGLLLRSKSTTSRPTRSSARFPSAIASASKSCARFPTTRAC